MAGAIGIEARRQAVRCEHLQQRSQRRGGAFLLDQKRRVDRARRVIHRDDQVERRLSIQPGRARAVLVQHHARTWLALALAPVCAASRGPLDQTRRVQLRLHPGVAPAKIMVAHQMLVKMLHVPASITMPVKLQHQPQLPRRDPLGRRLAKPPVDQSRKPVLLIAVAIAPELPLRHPQQLARLQHRQITALPAAQDIPKLLHPAIL